MAKLILGLAGEMASGKGTVAKFILEQKAGNSHRFSTMLRDVLNRLFIEKSRDNLQALSTTLRKTFGEDILAKVMYQEIVSDTHEIVIIDGVRRMADIALLQKLPEFKLIYIDAEIELRYQRIMSRHENADDGKKSFIEFKKAHDDESELQIRQLKTKADLIVDNNGTLENLYKQIDQLINNHSG